MKDRISAQYLQAGDIVGSKEVVVKVSSGLRTPSGKVEITLMNTKDGGFYRTATWGRNTKICIERNS